MYAAFNHLIRFDRERLGTKLKCVPQVYNKTLIRWTTHRPEGLSIKDVTMAAFCDEQGKASGELDAASADSNGSFVPKGRELAEALRRG